MAGTVLIPPPPFTLTPPAGPTPPEIVRRAAESRGQSAARDILPSLGTGLVQGAFELATLPATLLHSALRAGDWVTHKLTGQPRNTDYGLLDRVFDLQERGRTEIADELHQPTTTAGEFAQTIGQFIPGALAVGPAAGIRGAIGNVVRYGVIPGALSEGAGQIVEATNGPDWLNVAARGVVGALAMGGAAVAANAGAGAALPGSFGASAGVMARYLRGTGLTEAEVGAAQGLVNQASLRRVPVTWPEALHTVTNGRVDATGLQRVIEQSRGGTQAMADFMAERTAGIQPAFDLAAAQVGRVVPPAELGQTVQAIATNEIRARLDQINDATRPLYMRAAPTEIDPTVMADLMAEPLIADAVRYVRNSPVYGRFVEGLPDNSVGMLDAVKKRLEEVASMSANDRARTFATVYENIAGDARSVATAASPEYAEALATQASLRNDWLKPIEEGMIGKLAASPDLVAQVRAIFPRGKQLFEGSQEDVTRAMSIIAGQNPAAAAAILRQEIGQTFNAATKRLTRGANQFGAARFVSELQGDPQQYANMRAAFIAAYPDGAERFAGFQELMRVFEATGSRQTAGSGTAFNVAMQREMDRAPGASALLAAAASPLDAAGMVKRWLNEFRSGVNARNLAEIITNPASGPLLLELSRGGPLQDLQRIAAILITQNSTQTAVQPRSAVGPDGPQRPYTTIPPTVTGGRVLIQPPARAQ